MRKSAVILAVMGLVCVSLPAQAWGPQSQIAIVTTAGRMLAKEGIAPLSKMEKEIRQGASLTAGEFDILMPYADMQPVQAILTQIQLLQSVREAGVDPYFAFRMDIRPREMVNSAEYFARLAPAIEARQAMLERDYRAGLGFDGAARATYGEDISRSINAVGDVWYTILQRRSIAASISEEQKRGYVLRAMAFFIDRGKIGEIDAAHKRYEAIDVYTGDVMKEIGDMMYEAGLRERAVQEYLAVLEKEPERKDVVRRIADYYIDLADEELKEDRLELARDYYARALDVDPLHPYAESKRLTAEKLIRERDARLAEMQAAIAKARELEELAEVKASTKRYAEAISQLREALELYRGVTSEFVVEKRAAQAGINTVSARLQEMRARLQESASDLSGAGTGLDTAGLAEKEAAEHREAMYEGMIEHAYQEQVERLRPQIDLRSQETD